jgi:hypothetical protein
MLPPKRVFSRPKAALSTKSPPAPTSSQIPLRDLCAMLPPERVFPAKNHAVHKKPTRTNQTQIPNAKIPNYVDDFDPNFRTY